MTRCPVKGGGFEASSNDLLWLARVDGDPRRASRRAMSMSRPLQRLRRPISAVATAGRSTLRFHHEGREPAFLHASPAWIDRLIGVLVDNACRYAGQWWSRRGSGPNTGTRIVLDVDDSGPGIRVEGTGCRSSTASIEASRSGGLRPGTRHRRLGRAATDGTWSIRTAPLGGARMEVSWRRVEGDHRTRKWSRRLRFCRTKTEGPGRRSRGFVR